MNTKFEKLLKKCKNYKSMVDKYGEKTVQNSAILLRCVNFKLQAVLRSENFLIEREKLKETIKEDIIKAESELRKIVAKWYPAECAEPIDIYAAEEIAKLYPPFSIPNKINAESASKMLNLNKIIPQSYISTLNFQNNIDGNHIYLKLDITKTKDELLQKIENIIDIAKLFIPKNPNLNIENDIIWRIYDMHKNEKKTPYDIAHILDKEGYNTSYNNDINTFKKTVRKLFETAKDKITQVEQEAREREKQYMANLLYIKNFTPIKQSSKWIQNEFQKAALALRIEPFWLR